MESGILQLEERMTITISCRQGADRLMMRRNLFHQSTLNRDRLQH